jgi:hypothetical protein
MSRKLTKHAMNGEVWKNGEDEMRRGISRGGPGLK